MKNIKNAIQLETEYIQNRLNNINVILDLSSCGYDSLNDYFKDKKEYLLKTCGVQIKNNMFMEDIENVTETAILNGQPSLFIPYGEPLFAWHGDEPIDLNLCQKLGVVVHDMRYRGGTIVCGENDLEVELVIPNKIDVNAQYFLQKIVNIIPNATIDHNDIMVNNKKVLGSMEREVNNMFIFAFHASFSDQSAIASQICTKPAIKEIGFLPIELKENIRNEVISWVRSE